MTLRSCFYVGRVMHYRLRPVRHRFTYNVFSLYLDLDELDAVDRELRLLSVERPNLLSFRAGDHGPRDGSPLGPWVRAQLAAEGIDDADGPLMLLCLPRLLGYVFNPLSVYFCHAAAGPLRAVVYEVKNTFGEQHCYTFRVDPDVEPIAHACDKAMYVSPFIGMAARYRLKVETPGERLALVIRESEPDGPTLLASHIGRRRPLTDGALLAALARNPVLTLKVTAGIHFEALRLWLKGAPVFARQPAVGEAPGTRSRAAGETACDMAMEGRSGGSR